jgi:hypothetical protein
MALEYLLITLLICAATVPLLAVFWHLVVSPRLERAGILWIWVGFPALVIIPLFLNREPASRTPEVTFRPIQVQSHGYIGSAGCRSCHPHHHATWWTSYHRTMTQIATPDSILPAVKDIQFNAQGLNFRLHWHGEQLWSAMEMPDARPDAKGTIELRRPIVMTTGSHHMQILWFPLKADRRFLGMFPFVYLKEQQRWIPRGASFLQPRFSLSDEIGRWNQTCIACHTTFGRMLPTVNIDPQTGRSYLDPNNPDSRVAEFGISCEACHGPGEKHASANRDPATRYLKHLSGQADSTIVNPANLPHHLKSQVCGQCHSVFCLSAKEQWWMNGFEYRPGLDLAQSKTRFIVQGDDPSSEQMQRVLKDDPAFLKDHFWPDGMIRISGREYNGLIESACYQRGEMSCMSCHGMHQAIDDGRDPQEWANDQLHPLATTNQACLQCHPQFQRDGELVQHTHHDAGSSGSNCYNCHMSYTTYGLLKAIRSHQIDSPSVATSLDTGRPNACNQCHLDKTLAWTSAHLANWYGIESPDLSEDDQNIAASVVWLLSGDAGQRALMAWSYGWSEARKASGTEWMAPYLAQLLEDPYAAVRFVAGESLRTVRGFTEWSYDFLGTPADLAASRRRVRQAWSRTAKTPAEAVLINRQGALMEEVFERLLQRRDDSEITLVE